MSVVVSPSRSERRGPASGDAGDFVLVAVKSYDTDRVASMLGPLVGDDTAVVSLQNGVDNEERLAAVLGDDRVVGGAAYIFATIAEPGVIDHTGGPASLVVGEWRGGTSQRVTALVEAFRAADVTADDSSNIRAVLWSKFAFICAQAGVTAAVRLPIGEIRSQPAGRELFRNLAAEVCAVAAAEGVELPADLPDKTLGFADALEPSGGSSLYHDLVHGRRMELDTLLGEVVRRGEHEASTYPRAGLCTACCSRGPHARSDPERGDLALSGVSAPGSREHRGNQRGIRRLQGRRCPRRECVESSSASVARPCATITGASERTTPLSMAGPTGSSWRDTARSHTVDVLDPGFREDALSRDPMVGSAPAARNAAMTSAPSGR